MYTLGDKQFKHIDVSAFLDTLQGALLADSNCDIRKLVLLILSHACVKCPNDVSDKLDSLSDAIKVGPVFTTPALSSASTTPVSEPAHRSDGEESTARRGREASRCEEIRPVHLRHSEGGPVM
jgi:hypothetical protein